MAPMETRILDHLKVEGSISAVEAQALYRCRSLSRRITSLNATHIIRKEHKRDHTGQRYVRYVYVQPRSERHLPVAA
jgi:hypothetical protein